MVRLNGQLDSTQMQMITSVIRATPEIKHLAQVYNPSARVTALLMHYVTKDLVTIAMQANEIEKEKLKTLGADVVDALTGAETALTGSAEEIDLNIFL